jgi:outer membrane biosynthesis protein TonB
VTSRRLTSYAFLASLLLHLLVGALTWNLSLLRGGDSAQAAVEKADKTVEVVLVPDEETAPPEAAKPRTPTAYTEIPERLATERPPDQADFLALYNARAADRRPGGKETDRPGADRPAEVPQVAISPEDLARAPGVQVPPSDAAREVREMPEQLPEPAQRAVDDVGAHGDWDLQRAQEEQAAKEGRKRQEKTRETDWVAETDPPSVLKSGDGATGDRGFEFQQTVEGDMTTSTSIEGDFSLNTYEWNYAPWMHRFVQDLYRNWMAPYAYRLGVIYGVTRIRLVVEKDGRPSAMDIVETEGHESLHKASLAALQAFAPYAPLPANFPEPQLVILLSLHYPQWK